MAIHSAGILLYQRSCNGLSFFLVHPGGPYFRKKNKGWWGIPKGLPMEDEELEKAAIRELREETGITITGPLLPIGEIKQKGGKIIHAWAAEMGLPVGWELECNTFTLEWPPRSGKFTNFPEVDDARFFTEEEAMEYINPAQAEFINRLKASVL
jgi:predicted NUDIX family NTP pyrophosphohydrolase